MTRTHVPILHQKKEAKPRSRLTRGSRIKPVGAKMAKISKLYRALKLQFLQEHPYCQHWIAECGLNEADVIIWGGRYKVNMLHPLTPTLTYDGMGQVPRSAEVHHKRGRGKYHLDVSTWMAVRPGHATYIHEDPLRYEKGYCLPR